MPFEIVRSDITKTPADAIVNAANPSLLGGGGVDGAIHAAAGPKLLEACKKLGGCAVGEAKITKAYDLPARYVIHTVGPIWQGGTHGEEELLSRCYTASLELAVKHRCESVVFPLISSGAYGYPKEQALKVATRAIRSFLESHEMKVTLAVYDRASYAISREMFEDIRAYIADSSVPDLREEERRRGMNLPGAFMPYSGQAPSIPEAARDLSEKPLFPQNREGKAFREEPEEECAAPAPVSAPRGGRSLFRKKAEIAGEAPEAAYAAPSGSLEDYLRQLDEGFREMLLRKIDESGMTDAECYRRANVDRKLFNKIKNQKGYRPGKTTVLAFAVALCLPLEETDELLKKAGFTLSHSSKGDLIVEYFIRRGEWDIWEINAALFSFDQKLLGSGA